MDKWDDILQTASTCWDKMLMYLPLLSDHGSDSGSGVIVVPVFRLILKLKKVVMMAGRVEMVL